MPPSLLPFLLPLSGLHFISNKWVVLLSSLMRFFQPPVSLSLAIKNSQLLKAENKIWPEVSWEYSLIIGVDIFKSLFKKKKKMLWEKKRICHGMNICLSTLEWGLYIFSWKQGAFLFFFQGESWLFWFLLKAPQLIWLSCLAVGLKKKKRKKKDNGHMDLTSHGEIHCKPAVF